MTTMTVERSKELASGCVPPAIGTPIPCVRKLERHLATHDLDELAGSIRSGESLVTREFLDERITVGKEYRVRAIGNKRYAKFVGRLKLIRPSYGWILTFEDVKYISGYESLQPAMERGLAEVSSKGTSFTIYADSTPSGYGLQDFPFQPACTG